MELVRVEIIMNDVKMDKLLVALRKYKVSGMTVFKAMGCGGMLSNSKY
ncbi:MAG: hypothetical protein II374_05335 [Lachnospiraceae bacterium]|nr:hypothetical protein [Lachnospiraceae bacterium]